MEIPVAKNYIKEFEKLGFGLFVHWGLYSQLGQGEWIYLLDESVKNNYEKLMDTFTAEDFNAEELVLFSNKVGLENFSIINYKRDAFFGFIPPAPNEDNIDKLRENIKLKKHPSGAFFIHLGYCLFAHFLQ